MKMNIKKWVVKDLPIGNESDLNKIESVLKHNNIRENDFIIFSEGKTCLIEIKGNIRDYGQELIKSICILLLDEIKANRLLYSGDGEGLPIEFIRSGIKSITGEGV